MASKGWGQTQEVSSKRWQGPRGLCKGLTISLSTMEGVGGFETSKWHSQFDILWRPLWKLYREWMVRSKNVSKETSEEDMGETFQGMSCRWGNLQVKSSRWIPDRLWRRSWANKMLLLSGYGELRKMKRLGLVPRALIPQIGWLSSSPGAAITKYHRLGGFKQQTSIFSQFWRLGAPRLECWQIWFLVRALFLTCRWKPFHCVLTWPFLCVSAVREESLVFFPLPLRIPVLLD